MVSGGPLAGWDRAESVPADARRDSNIVTLLLKVTQAPTGRFPAIVKSRAPLQRVIRSVHRQSTLGVRSHSKVEGFGPSLSAGELLKAPTCSNVGNARITDLTQLWWDPNSSSRPSSCKSLWSCRLSSASPMFARAGGGVLLARKRRCRSFGRCHRARATGVSALPPNDSSGIT